MRPRGSSRKTEKSGRPRFQNRGAIIRVKRIDHGFGLVPDRVFQDKTISLKARVLVAYLYGRPIGWTPVVSALCGTLGITDFTWRSVKEELEGAGMVVSHQCNGADGRFVWELVFDLSRYDH
ncbi:MAG: hypothetical protein C0423_01890 [Methylibium sp.]|nr:hypothetical protein [Methylibium sp.]